MDQRAKLLLPEDLTIYNVSKLKELIVEKLELDLELLLDFKTVEEIDSAGIQILLSLKKTLRDKKLDFELVGVNQRVREVFRLAGVEDIFNFS